MESYLWMNLLSITWQWVLQEKSLRSHLTPFNRMRTTINGEISYEEFMNAAEDFYRGTEETELSEAFFVPLMD